jgi:hypothetical protein
MSAEEAMPLNGTDTDLEDIPAHFHDVVRKYGRDMYFLVMHAAMAGQATAVMQEIFAKHQSRHGLHAVALVAQGFNVLSNAYCAKMGWTEEVLAQCDRDCQLAARSAIIPAGSRILLNS